MKFLIKYSPLILLLGVMLTACGTATPVSPVEVQMTSMAAQAQACATLQAIGTPYPCNPPTATLQPTSTLIPPPTPTATPFTGWMHYPEGGGATPMPLGFEPNCEGAVGCPGSSYTYFINGVPQNGVPGSTKGTPGYWPYVMVGVPVGLAVLALLFFTAYGMAAPQRAIAKATLLMAQAYASTLGQVQGNPALPSGAENMGIPVEFLAKLLVEFARHNEVPRDFKRVIGDQLRQYHRGDLVPLVTVQTMLLGFDKEYASSVAKPFRQFLESHAHELLGGSNG